MKFFESVTSWKKLALSTVIAGVSLTLFAGCNGIAIPGIPVSIPLVQNVQVTAEQANAGSAEVAVGAICDLFTQAELDALVRQAAGDQIADLVTISKIELTSVEVSAVAGDFSGFSSADLDVTIVGSSDAPLNIGSASSTSSFGSNISLVHEPTIDLLTKLEDGQCGVPILTLTGDGDPDSTGTTFNVTINTKVFVRVSLF